MSGATPWSVNGLDPEAQDAAREQARKHGMTLGEWLNQSILAHEEAARLADEVPTPGPYVGPALDGAAADDWSLKSGDVNRMTEAMERLAQRIEASERRAALSMTGLDRTVLGLAARVEDAEAGVRHASATVSGAVEEIRRTGDAITERVTHAEALAREVAGEASVTLQDINATRQTIVQRLADAEDAARRAALDMAATVLAETRDSQAELAARIENAEAFSREVAAAAAAEIRAAQDSLADRMSAAEQDARDAALEAVRTLRADQKAIEDRLAFAEASGREIAAETMRELQGTQATMQDRLRQVELETRRATSEAIADVRQAHAELAERVAAAGMDERTAEFLRDIETAQRGLATRFEKIEAIAHQTADTAAAEVAEGHRAIEARLEQIEQATREAAANLRMGAAAAINQVRAAQLELEKRVKMVEAGASFGGAVDSDRLRETHAQIQERLDRVERNGGGQDRAALHMLDAKITGLAATVRDSRDRTAVEIESLHARIESAGSAGGGEYAARLNAVEKTVEDAIARLADRLVKAETTANNAIRQLESAPGAHAETEALRTMVEARLEGMAASMTEMVGGVRAEIASKITGEGGLDIDQSLQEVHQRVALSERRQSQTIEAISIEIRRMSESIDRRLRNLETRNDDSAAVAVREEVARLANALEERVGGLENREIAGVDRVGVEMGRLAERFDERFDGVERRSAEAIEHVGEQVARMAERFSVRQDQVARELTERIVESEERQAARLTETIATVASKLSAVEERTTTTLSPVQKAMSSLAARLQAVEDGSRGALAGFETIAASQSADPDDMIEAFDGDMVAPIDFSDIKNIAAQIRGDVIEPPPPAVIETEAVDVESIEATSMSFDAFDTLLPKLEEFPQAAPAPDGAEPHVHAEANDIAFPWDDGEDAVTEAQTAHDDDMFAPATPPASAAAPADKSDYLSNARRAAQAAAQPGKKRASTKDADERKPVQGLRGSNRVVLWSAAGALAVALAGGAYLVKVRGNSERASDAGEASGADALAAAPGDAAIPGPDAVIETSLAPVDGAPLDDTTNSDVPLAPVDAGVTTSSIADAAAKEQATTRERARPAKAAPRASATTTTRTPQGPQAGISASVQNVALSASGGRAGLSLEQAALRGDAVAQYELGLQRLAGNQTPEGVALLRRAANQGLAMAQYRLAKLFERGEGVPADLQQARQWTERAAAAGNRKAMHDLGVYYARGEGAPLDEATAFRWFRQAAELGVADSQFNLGVLYQQGRGAPADAKEALFWFTVAARSGDNDARARAATLEAQLPPDVSQQARNRAISFAAKPASARANGEFGQRVWSSDSAQAAAPPRS